MDTLNEKTRNEIYRRMIEKQERIAAQGMLVKFQRSDPKIKLYQKGLQFIFCRSLENWQIEAGYVEVK